MRFLAFLLLLAAASAPAQLPAPWQMEPSETTADLRGIHAVGGGVVWASGSGGTVLRSQDSGFEWQQCAIPPGAEKLDFRAIWAWDDRTALVMSSGPGPLSRVYRTTDGCAHWSLLYTNPDKDGFWDALAFSDRGEGYIFGDPVPVMHQLFASAGKEASTNSPGNQQPLDFQLFATHDGGQTWSRQVEDLDDGMSSDGKEGAFAASNSSLFLLGHRFWLGIGGAVKDFVLLGDVYQNASPGTLIDNDRNARKEIWVTHRAAAPLADGSPSAGIFSLNFRTEKLGLAVGGDYSKPDERRGTAAYTADGGEHWTASAVPPGGYRSAVSWDEAQKAWIAVGPNGSDVSRDDGRTWQPLEHAPASIGKAGEWNALSLPWVVGPHGRIGKLNGSALP